MRLNIIYLAEEFYALEAISCLLSGKDSSNFMPFRHSHEKWRSDFEDYRARFNAQLAQTIFDYTVLVVGAELRHSELQSDFEIVNFMPSCHDDDIRRGERPANRPCHRSEAFTISREYTSDSILKCGEKYFDESEHDWWCEYGGNPWMLIAKAGLMKGNVADSIFIDHCVDLSHNNGCYFDKSAGIFMTLWESDIDEYARFLDKKRSCGPEMLLNKTYGEEFHQLLQRAVNLGILNIKIIQPEGRATDYYRHTENVSALMQYTPITWGKKVVGSNDHPIILKYQKVKKGAA